jgi:ribosomal protein L16 Arg81 hydroxylase
VGATLFQEIDATAGAGNGPEGHVGRLEHLLRPVTEDDFMADYWEKRPLVLHRRDQGYYGALFSLRALDQILADSNVRSTVRVVKKGQPLLVTKVADITPGVHRGNGDMELVLQEYRNGSTLVFPYLHERSAPLREMARRLSSQLSASIQINAYLTPSQACGFSAHYDTHDVIILQIHGSKQWRIFPAPVRLPLADNAFRADPEFDPGEPIEECLLRQGDVLYLPRGYVHDATSMESTSLHLTVGIKLITWASVVLGAVTALVNERPELRAALPPGFATNPLRREDAKESLTQLMGTVCRDADVGAAIEAARTEALLSREPDLVGHLLDLDRQPSLEPHTTVRRRTGVEWSLEQPEGGDQVCLTFNGKRVCMPARLEGDLRFVIHADAFTAAELPGDLDDEERLVLTRRLLQEGFLTLLG